MTQPFDNIIVNDTHFYQLAFIEIDAKSTKNFMMNFKKIQNFLYQLFRYVRFSISSIRHSGSPLHMIRLQKARQGVLYYSQLCGYYIDRCI